MSYTSGRTVKTRAARVDSPVAAATKTTRAAVTAAFGRRPGVTVDSTQTAWGPNLDPAVRTTVTFPATLDAAILRRILAALPDVVALTLSDVSVTVTRTI